MECGGAGWGAEAGVSLHPCPTAGSQARPQEGRSGGAGCALTSSDRSSSLGLVLRKWKTVSQGVRSSSGLGGDDRGAGREGLGGPEPQATASPGRSLNPHHQPPWPDSPRIDSALSRRRLGRKEGERGRGRGGRKGRAEGGASSAVLHPQVTQGSPPGPPTPALGAAVPGRSWGLGQEGQRVQVGKLRTCCLQGNLGPTGTPACASRRWDGQVAKNWGWMRRTPVKVPGH